MSKRKYKRQRLVVGDKILLLAEPRKRAVPRVDRNVPIDYETYLAEREEREREAARSKVFAAMRSVSSGARPIGEHEEPDAENNVDHDNVATGTSYTTDAAAPRASMPPARASCTMHRPRTSGTARFLG